jgi:hypothetical protein
VVVVGAGGHVVGALVVASSLSGAWPWGTVVAGGTMCVAAGVFVFGTWVAW